MAQKNVATFKASKNSRYADNTSGSVSAGDSRDMFEDVADSFINITDGAYTSYGVTAAGTDTYTATLSPAITAYSSGQRFVVKFTNANTGAATLNFNSVGAKSIVKNGSTALAAGDIAAGQTHMLYYDGTNLQIVGNVGTSASTTIASGTYTPTGTAVSNVDSVVPDAAQYIRIGSVVTVSGTITINITTATTNTEFELSLPIASNFATLNQCAGCATSGFAEAVLVIADATSNRAQFSYVCGTDTGPHVMSFTFTYSII